MTVKQLLTGLIALMFLALQACEGPAGPAGAKGETGVAGANGANGTNGTDAGFVYFEGFKDSLQCATCHNPDIDTTYRVITREVQWSTSGHATMGDFTRNTTTCAGCHTNEGFFERYTKGFANETFDINTPSGPMVSQSYPNSSPQGCFTCHTPHSRGNFSVRDSNAVNIFTLLANQTTKVWNSTESSNLCVKCHQPRMTSTFLNGSQKSWRPDPSKTDTAKIYTTRWDNHVSGEQTQILLGFGGFEFTGYSYPQSYHNTLVGNKNIGCEDCHMATASGNQYGGHTFRIGYQAEGSSSETFNFAGCNASTCHAGGVTTSSSYWTVRNEIMTKVNMLGMLMADTNITKKWSAPQSGKAVPWVSMSVSGTDTSWAPVNASSSKPLVIVPAFKAGALWNLTFVEDEKSYGIHNTKYARALLDASIAELQK
jgi:hypothetical protein